MFRPIECLLVLRLDPLGKVLDAQFLTDELLALSHPEFEFELELSILLPASKNTPIRIFPLSSLTEP